MIYNEYMISPKGTKIHNMFIRVFENFYLFGAGKKPILRFAVNLTNWKSPHPH